jgi:xanthine dehydrogenase small subunit
MAKDYILLYINGRRIEVRGKKAFFTLADFLRYEQHLTGTKVVCAEGDCGACTVLCGVPTLDKGLNFKPLNSCISFIHLLDGTQIITIEGLKKFGKLNVIQQAMVENYGSQCGFCTPGMVMALAGLLENKSDFNEKHVRNYLTGNLCRCTGYQSIIDAAMSINVAAYEKMQNRYGDEKIIAELQEKRMMPVYIETEKYRYSSPIEMQGALKFKKEYPDAKIFAGATDLGVQYNKGLLKRKNMLSLHLISAMHEISINKNEIVVGAKANLSELQNLISGKIPEFARLLNIFASPQIKEWGSLVGNIANASPVGDTLPFLLLVDAKLEIQSMRGIRRVNINGFYQDYKVMDLKPDEIITRIFIPIPNCQKYMRLYKSSQRQDLDIASVNAGFHLIFDQSEKVKQARIVYGGVGATVLRLFTIEDELRGKDKTYLASKKYANKVSEMIIHEIKPLSDVRGSATKRLLLAQNLYKKFLFESQLLTEVW